MTIHEMLHQVALLSSGNYQRKGEISTLEIPLPRHRKQVIYGKNEIIRGEPVGLLYTHIGMLDESIDLVALLGYNAKTQFAKVAILPDSRLVLTVMFDLINTSIKECAPMLQEMAAVADELERIYFITDEK